MLKLPEEQRNWMSWKVEKGIGVRNWDMCLLLKDGACLPILKLVRTVSPPSWTVWAWPHQWMNEYLHVYVYFAQYFFRKFFFCVQFEWYLQFRGSFIWKITVMSVVSLGGACLLARWGIDVQSTRILLLHMLAWAQHKVFKWGCFSHLPPNVTT